jgi:hypothetical protein
MAPAKERKNVILIFICNVDKKERICIIEHVSLFYRRIIFIAQNKYRYLILVIYCNLEHCQNVEHHSYISLVWLCISQKTRI